MPFACPGSEEDKEGFGLEGARESVGMSGVGAVRRRLTAGLRGEPRGAGARGVGAPSEEDTRGGGVSRRWACAEDGRGGTGGGWSALGSSRSSEAEEVECACEEREETERRPSRKALRVGLGWLYALMLCSTLANVPALGCGACEKVPAVGLMVGLMIPPYALSGGGDIGISA